MNDSNEKSSRPCGCLHRAPHAAGLALLAALITSAATAGPLKLVSQDANGPCSVEGVSGDGRYILFMSPATNLVQGQLDAPFAPGSLDVFLYDQLEKRTLLVSRSSSSATTGGLLGNRQDDSQLPVLSADGRYVAFVSHRRDLVPGQSGPTSPNVFLYDRKLDTMTLVTHRIGSSTEGTSSLEWPNPAISANGRFVAYTSNALDLAIGRERNAGPKLVLFDRLTGNNTFVDDDNHGWVRMSADGRFLVYSVGGQGQVWLYDRLTASRKLVSHAAGAPQTPSNGPSGIAPYPEISADGSTIAFGTYATDLVPGQVDAGANHDLFIYDRATDQTTLLSRSQASPTSAANGNSYVPSLSADGRWIAFHSKATDLVAGVNDSNASDDVFLFDRLTGTTRLISHASASNARASQRGAAWARLNADGTRLSFSSTSGDLVQGQPDPASWTNHFLFMGAEGQGLTSLVGQSWRPGISEPHYLTIVSEISADGSAVAFSSSAALVPEDRNNEWDVYVLASEPSIGPATFVRCLLLDTREPAYAPALRSGARRAVSVRNACGLPSSAVAATLEITVLRATGKGNLRFYSGKSQLGGTFRFDKGKVRDTGLTLPLSASDPGTFEVLPFVAGNGTVQMIVEVVAYTE